MPPAELTGTTPTQDRAAAADPRALCQRIFSVFADGELPDFEALFHPEAANREASTQPRACRGRGPAAFYATGLWLRSALADMRWDIHEIAADGDIMVVHTTARARQTGPFVIYDQAGAVRQVFPPTSKSTSATQTHWFRLADGKIIEHWANRDDMTMAQQLGWIPPSPRYLLRMILAKRKARTTPS
ncbi:MAG TPA: ester cyclase [Streptosporangiaceae bacterium]